jgi:hypothetical protein
MDAEHPSAGRGDWHRPILAKRFFKPAVVVERCSRLQSSNNFELAIRNSYYCYCYSYYFYSVFFWKLLAFMFQFGILETLLCSMSAFQLKIVLMLHTHQLVMMCKGNLMYLEPKLFGWHDCSN